jgi:hypothetical protein
MGSGLKNLYFLGRFIQHLILRQQLTACAGSLGFQVARLAGIKRFDDHLAGVPNALAGVDPKDIFGI